MELRRRNLRADRHLHPHHALTARAALIPFTALILATPAFGQVSVEVSPLRVELTASAGSTATQAITVSNSSKEAVRVRARITDWELSRDGAPQFEGAKQGGPFSATDWVRIAPPELVVDAGKEGIVRFTLSVPAAVQPAGYRTGILFEFLPVAGERPGKSREVQFRSRIATLIYVNVGQPPIAVELTDLRVRSSAAQTQVVAVLNNTSKRTVRTKGTLTLFDQSGARVREAVVPDVPLLPEFEREVAITAFESANPLPAGEYRVEVRIDVGMPAVIVGETTLKVPK